MNLGFLGGVSTVFVYFHREAFSGPRVEDTAKTKKKNPQRSSPLTSVLNPHSTELIILIAYSTTVNALATTLSSLGSTRSPNHWPKSNVVQAYGQGVVYFDINKIQNVYRYRRIIIKKFRVIGVIEMYKKYSKIDKCIQLLKDFFVDNIFFYQLNDIPCLIQL